jgi:DNA invertase Pin-like site-specific DNA recombinase
MPRGVIGSRTVNKHGYELFPHIAPRGALRAFTYRRKSKNAKEDDVSLDEQWAANSARIQERGWVHVGDAWDLGAEGVDPERPGYRQMLDWGREDRFDVLVVWRSDRPFRGVAAAGPLAMLLYETSNRIALESVTDHFDANYLGINAFVGDTERQAIRRRTMDTRLNYARRGQLMAGTLPYWIGRNEQNRGVLLDDRAAIIVELITRYVGGERTRDLARWMRQVAPAADYHRGATWSVDRIGSVLAHRALVGELPYSAARYTRRRDAETGNRVRHREWKDEGEIVIIPVPALLHETAADKTACSGCEMDGRPTFKDLEAARTKRRSKGDPAGPGRPAVHRHPLRTKVFCGVCEGQMTMQAATHYIARTGERRPYEEPKLYLRCPRSNGNGRQAEQHMDAGTHRCRIPALLRVVDVYDQVLEQLRRTDLPDAIERAAEAYTRQAAAAAKTPAMLLEELEFARRRLQDLTAEEVQLYKATLSQGAFKILQQELLVKQEGVEQRVKELERHIEDAERDRRLYDVIGAAELATTLREVPWSELTDEDWAELVPALVYRVLVDKENRVVVDLALHGSPHLAITVSNHSDTAISNLSVAA